MKNNYKNLKKLYKAYIKNKTLLYKEDCPSPEEILKCFKSKLSKKQKIKIIDHLIDCFYCAQEFEFILETLRFEKKIINDIDILLHSIKKKSNCKAISSPKKQRLFFLQIPWKYAFLSAFIILTISVISVFIHNIFERDGYRGVNLPQINLIDPIGEKKFNSPLVFKWSELKGSNYYILDIFDETLYPIWKSNKIYKNKFILPHEISRRLYKNERYFWMITAFYSNEVKFESPLKEFTIN